MKNRMVAVCVVMSAVAFSFLLVGCDRQVSRSESSKVSSDGTVKTSEETVTRAPDGTVTKTEESKTTDPNNR